MSNEPIYQIRKAFTSDDPNVWRDANVMAYDVTPLEDRRIVYLHPERVTKEMVDQMRKDLTNVASIDSNLSLLRATLELEIKYHRKPLTPEQLSQVMESVDFTYNPTRFARAVEAAHGITEEPTNELDNPPV